LADFVASRPIFRRFQRDELVN